MNFIVAFLSEVGGYLAAVFYSWWSTLAIFLAVERLAERFFHGWWKRRVDPIITPAVRKRMLIWFACLAFVCANFSAYTKVSEALTDSTNKASVLSADLDAERDKVSGLQHDLDQKDRQIADFQSKAASPPSPPPARDPDGLYQLGVEVASVGQVATDVGNSSVYFGFVRSAGTLDASREVEYRDFVLQCTGLPQAPRPGTITGAVTSLSSGVRCEIVRAR